jgi:MFS family permease
VPGVAAVDLEHAFAASHATLTLAIFLGPGVIALVVEPVLFLLADRYPRRWFVHGGLAAMALGAGLAALARGPVTLALALSIVWCATGTATAIAQAILVDASPDTRGRTLARWSLFSLAGDLAAPALLAVLALAGATWRAAFVIVGALLVGWLALIIRERPGQPATATAQPPTGHPEPSTFAAGRSSLIATLREALSDRLLIAWLFGMTLCDLLDEILVVFSTIHMRLDLGASRPGRVRPLRRS